VLSVLLRFTDSYYPFGICWPLCCLFFFDLRILITPLVSVGHCVICFSSIYGFILPLWYLLAIVLSVLLRFTDSYYPFDIFKLVILQKTRGSKKTIPPHMLNIKMKQKVIFFVSSMSDVIRYQRHIYNYIHFALK
jgi:hypothetical protein